MSNLLDSYQVLENVSQLWVARALISAANLGVADSLSDDERSIEDLASDLKLDSNNLYRLMRGLTAVGIFQETSPGYFSHTPKSKVLRSNDSNSVKNLVKMFGSARTLNALVNYDIPLQSGDTAYETNQSAFDAISDEDLSIYNLAMSESTNLHLQEIVEHVDFSSSRNIVDIGGGDGRLLLSILKKYSHLSGIVIDRPSVINAIKSTADLADRFSMITADFKVGLPPAADTYIAKNIFHGLNDSEALLLLQHFKKAGAAGAKIYIFETIISGSITDGAAKIFDLLLLLEGRGAKIRTIENFKSLFSDAQIEFVEVVQTTSLVNGIVGRIEKGGQNGIGN